MVSGRDIHYTMAHCEIWAGKDAEKAGNPEDRIYYAHKACFFAISHWLDFHEENEWEESEISYLKNIIDSNEFPQNIRDTA